MADFFIDNYCSRIINKLIDEKEYLPTDTATFKSLARLMFKHYPAAAVFQMVYDGLAEASDEQWFTIKYPKGFMKETFVFPKKKSVVKINLKKQALRKKINDNLKITEVAESYGIKVKGGKAVCPFHIDNDPSLSFSNEKNVFNCFGCHAKGDIITFIRRMENGKMLEL